MVIQRTPRAPNTLSNAGSSFVAGSGIDAMRNLYAALSSGLARQIALAVTLVTVAVLALAIVAVGHSTQAQHQGQRQQQVDAVATQAALTIRSRIGSAQSIAEILADVNSHFDIRESSLREQVNRSGVFSWAGIARPDASGMASAGQRRFEFSREQLSFIEAGRGAALIAQNPSGTRELYLAQPIGEGLRPQLMILEISGEWLWSPLRALSQDYRIVAFDSGGDRFYASGDHSDETIGLFTRQMRASQSAGKSQAIAWQSDSIAWVGSLTVLPHLQGAGTLDMGIVVGAAGASAAAAYFDALRKIWPAALFAVLLAIAAAAGVAGRHVPTLRQLRRGLTQLTDHETGFVADPQAGTEMRQLVDAFNRSAMIIDRQRSTQKTLAEIDALLIGSVDFETVVDQVLARIRAVTHSSCVGVTLIDSDAGGYGRLFAVSETQEFPVNRVILDSQMTATLCDSKIGLTVVRCEEVRHSFLVPMLGVGAQYFWVWPVMVGDRLVAILAVGYAEAPQLGERVAGYGTECARRLGSSLSTNARSELLYRQAHFDPLTDLPNRLLFRDRLAQELASAANASTRGALLYVDLDHFKKVNDTLGHHAGDQLLSIVAQRLRSCVKDGDTVARLGGDEFAVLLRQVAEPGSASAVSDRIIHALQMPISIAGKDHQVKASIGITLFPDNGSTLEELLRNADLAMYRAKDLGRGGAVFYEAKMARGAKVADSGLYRALKRREFSLYYQPQYSVGDGRLLGVEALLRWQTPKDGMRTSAEFIPAAEESGLIVDLGGWVLEAACLQIAQWRDEGLDPPKVAINLSVQQLRDGNFCSLVRRILERYQLLPGALEFELNEAALTDAESQSTIAELAALQMGLILDDFGTGHTALNNLRRYPVRAVKIDRTFIEEITENPASAAMASTIIVMAHAVNKSVVAEGVETIEQLDFLRERGCDIAQGYYLARPLPAAAMSEMLIGRLPVVQAETAARA
jgi:diguanylate cyclase (GGDEF)-like protein